MGNKVKFGLKNVHYAVVTEEDDGSVTYGTPVKIPGAVSLTLDPQGDQTEFYADNTKYYASFANNGYSGTLEMALIPDSFKKDVLGYKEDANGVLFEDVNNETKYFALLFEFSGDKNAARHVLYKVTSARPSISGTTIDTSKTPQTESLSISAAAASDTGLVKAKVDPEQSAYDTWYESVYTYVEETQG